jgi:cation diffusion facilitator family transporter
MGKSCCENKNSELLELREKQGAVLKIVLLINAVMFVIEFVFGLLSHSSALTADSLDMLGDAFVYAFSLYVLYRSDQWRAGAAMAKGLIIVSFAVFVLVNTTLKAFGQQVPTSETMGIIGAIALAANAACLLLLLSHRNDDLNMRSTFICSRNDIISNTGVLIAALMVNLTQSKWPDIIVGYAIALLFLKSAWPILLDSFRAIKQAPEASS